jgi:hypothetical protein
MDLTLNPAGPPAIRAARYDGGAMAPDFGDRGCFEPSIVKHSITQT